MSEVGRYKLYHWLDRYAGIAFCFLLFPLRGLIKKKGCAGNKILLIKLGMMGDAILLIPALRALREKFSQAHITMVCSVVNQQVFFNCPYLDEVVAVEFTKLLNPFFFLSFTARLRRAGYDLSIDFEQWSRASALISLLSFAKERIGFNTHGQYRHLLFTQAATHLKDKHEIDCFLDLLRPLGVEGKNRQLELFPRQEDIREAQRLIAERQIEKDFIILQCEVPESGRQRQWPLENFVRVAEELKKKYDYQVVIVSTAKGKEEAEKIRHLLADKAVVLSGLPLLTLYVITGKARLVLTNNSGFMHLAASSGAPVVALHGPTSSIKWGPAGKRSLAISSSLSCSPCLYLGYEYGCEGNRCMRQIEPAEVVKKIDQLLAANQRKDSDEKMAGE